MWFRYGEIRRLVKRVAELEAELKEERADRRRREDHLLNQVLLATGRRAAPEVIKPDPGTKSEPPITATDEARLIAYREAAVRAGLPVSEGDREWRNRRSGKPLLIHDPDEPYVLPQ